MAIVSVMVGVSLFSFQNSWRVQKRVADLTSTTIAEFERDKSLGQAMEVEGVWRDGAFVTDEVERLSHPRRPKLRGTIQTVDRDHGTIRMYGVPIMIDAATEFLDGRRTRLAALQPGRRIEVSSTIDEDGSWRARKIRTESLKESDKIKGIVTAVAMDGIAPDSLEISGITIILDTTERARNAQVELRRISLAMRMSRAALDCRFAAQNVLAGREVTAPDGEDVDPAVLLVESAEDLGEFLSKARDIGGVETAATDHGSRTLESGLWLAPLEEGHRRLDRHIAEFLSLVSVDDRRAGVYLEQTLVPFLQSELLPLIESYQADAEEAVALEVESISTQAGATARGLIATSIVALLFALALGRLVWSSISRPLLELKSAAELIGQGKLETRVAIRSRDELGVLAATINHMAEELSATTVSIENLENIIDSAAGALIVLSPEGAVTSANRAAASLLGYGDGGLIGLHFAAICVEESGGDNPIPSTAGQVTGEERTFRRRDGSSVPVSFAGAALLGDGGAAQGFVCIAQDLTERQSMEEQLRQSLNEKELLLREVHHRVKNNLQVISSLLDLQAGELEDSATANIYEDSQRRIRSMALIHQQLYNASDLDHIDFGAYLETLIGSLFSSFGGGRAEIELRAEVVQARLAIDQALACGLIINELVTNALKHAFAPGANGVVTIRFETTAAGVHCLEIADNGRGMSETAARQQSSSLGMSLVTAFVEQLEGELNVTEEQGTTFRIDFPADVGAQEVRSS